MREDWEGKGSAFPREDPHNGEARFCAPAPQKPDSLRLPEIRAVRASDLNTRGTFGGARVWVGEDWGDDEDH